MTKTTLFAGGLLLTAGLAAGQAFAATPAEGTLTIDNTLIEFSEGPNTGANPSPDTGTVECVEAVLPCDTFALTVDLPDQLADFYPSSLVRMVFDADDPTGAGQEDYDIYLYDGDGNLVAESVSSGVPESIVQLAYGGVREYEIVVAYYIAIGSTYTGKVELVLGEPSPDKTQEEIDDFLMSESVVARALSPDQTVEASPRSAARAAGGGLGGLTLLLALAGLRRRRR